jgi:hypothetical protein
MIGDKVSGPIIIDDRFDWVCDQSLKTIKSAWVDRWTGGTAKLGSWNFIKTMEDDHL